MLRFIAYAVPLLILLLALFGFTVELLDAEPRRGSVIRLALFEQPLVPGQLVIGTWLVETSGLIALFLLAQGRFGTWWLDGLVAGWVAWVFRGPLLVITIVVAARQPQDPWWKLAFGWWVLYSICGLSLAVLARRSGLESWAQVAGKTEAEAGDLQATLHEPEVERRNPIEEEAGDREPSVDEIPAGETESEDVALASLREDVETVVQAMAQEREPGPEPEKIETEETPEPEPTSEASDEPVAEPVGSPAGGTAAAGGDDGKK